MQDLVSVIVPIFRVEEYLEECIKSIINQTYSNLEIILVDDGSDDGSGTICDKYAMLDSRIKVVHQENKGLDGARKTGILTATGKYVGYVDGDDWIEPEMYEQLVALANKYDVDVVESGVIDSWSEHYSKRVPFFAEGAYKDEKFEREIEPRILYCGRFFRYGISPYLWNKLFKKECIRKYQMSEEILNKTADDVVVTIPSVASAKSLYVTHRCYYHYRVRTNSGKRVENITRVQNFIKSREELKHRFIGTRLVESDDKQIDTFVMYWLIMNAPYVFDNIEEQEILFPFGGIRAHANVAIYGAGGAGMHMYNYLERMPVNIVAWLDKNYASLKSTVDVLAPSEIQNIEFDYVVLSILREEFVQSAKRELMNLGVPREKILWIKEEYLDNPKLLLNRIHQ